MPSKYKMSIKNADPLSYNRPERYSDGKPPTYGKGYKQTNPNLAPPRKPSYGRIHGDRGSR